MIELSDLFPITRDLSILDPNGDLTGVTLKVTSQDTKAFRALARTLQQKFLGEEKPTADQLEDMNAQLTAACVVGWEGLTVGGEPLPYSAEKALELMTMPELSFMREQVERFISKRVHFFRKREAAA